MSFYIPPDACLWEGLVTNTHLERQITHPAELSNAAWWIFVGRESGGDLGGRSNVSDIHQNLTPEEADETEK